MGSTESIVQESEQDAVVSVDHVSKIYGDGPESVTALNDIDIDVRRGEFLSIVGPSGCGKSTLLHLTGGILEPTEGTITFEGVDVQSPEHENNSVGLVFQHPILLEWRTVLQNVLLPIQIMLGNGSMEGDMDEYREEARRLIELVGLDGFEDAYPNELSGGMQQRVSICQSIIYDPSLLLMDEPFGSLDALTKKQLNAEFLELWAQEEMTIVFVTHDLEEAVFLSDRIAVMSARPGEIVDVIDVGIDRPRTDETRQSDEYHEYVSQAYEYFND
jgi:NitT/TauT family transport system ATP-binding protein